MVTILAKLNMMSPVVVDTSVVVAVGRASGGNRGVARVGRGAGAGNGEEVGAGTGGVFGADLVAA